MRIKFIVEGMPVGKGRPQFARYGNTVHIYTPEKTVVYENLVRLMYQKSSIQQTGGIFRFADDEAVSVNIQAYYAIPKSTSNSKRKDMISGAVRPIKKCDADNIAKIICDSLNQIAYDDDKQVVELNVKKWYSRPLAKIKKE